MKTNLHFSPNFTKKILHKNSNRGKILSNISRRFAKYQPHKQDIDFKFSIIFLSSKIILLWFLGQLGVWPSVTVLTPSIMSSFLNMRPGVPPWSNNVQVGCYHDPFHFLLCQVESLPCQVASCWFIVERGFINLDRF